MFSADFCIRGLAGSGLRLRYHVKHRGHFPALRPGPSCINLLIAKYQIMDANRASREVHLCFLHESSMMSAGDLQGKYIFACTNTFVDKYESYRI
jgi:hypothetical protein